VVPAPPVREETLVESFLPLIVSAPRKVSTAIDTPLTMSWNWKRWLPRDSRGGPTPDPRYKTFNEYLGFLKQHHLGDVLRKELKPDACELIAELSAEHQFTNILEIGRSRGFSFGLFRYLNPAAFVVSIDIVHRPEADRVAEQFDDNYLFIVGTSKAVRHLGLQFDLVLIDGDHSYAGAKQDWENVQSSLAPSSIVLFDNVYHPAHCGRVFEEITGFEKKFYLDGYTELKTGHREAGDVNQGIGIVYCQQQSE
jgi:hypothetical protein